MEERLYLTDEDLIFAEANGIPRKNARFRFDVQGWSVEKAITFPVRQVQRHGWEEWKDIAALCGVSYMTWWKRVSNGMPKEEAATKPPKRSKV